MLLSNFNTLNNGFSAKNFSAFCSSVIPAVSPALVEEAEAVFPNTLSKSLLELSAFAIELSLAVESAVVKLESTARPFNSFNLWLILSKY